VAGALTGLQNSGADLKLGAANLFYVSLVDNGVAFGVEELHDLANEYYAQWKLDPAMNPCVIHRST
jgi:hypothetical protein